MFSENSLYKKACVRYSWRETFAKYFLDIWKLSGKYTEGLYTWDEKKLRKSSGTCPRRCNRSGTQRVGRVTQHPEIPPVVTSNWQQSIVPRLQLASGWASPYLLVGSRVGLPEALHFAEGDVCAVRQAAQEGARRLLGESRRHLLFFHGRLWGFAFAQAQGPWLQLIMQLHRINCQVALSWESEIKSKPPTSTRNSLAKRIRTIPRKQTDRVWAPNLRG